MAQASFGPPSLPVGTEVSAKYRGAFCEAKVKTVVRVVKCKVVMKDSQSSIFVTDEEIKGHVKLGSVVEVKHPDTGQPVEATISKLIDNSTYTVVFDDGDERTLRRTQLCLKGEKHFIESETLDNLPLSHPEHFGTPVLQNKKTKRRNDDESDDEDEDTEEESPRRAMYRGRHQELVGKLMLVDLPNRKGSAIPALVVLPDANSLSEVKNRDQILVRSFKDSKFMTITRKVLKDFSRTVAIKNDDKTMRTAFEKALLYHDTKELPVGWNREEMLGSDVDDNDDEDVEDEYASEDEPFEEKDRFVAQLYKFMEERGTPINKGPCIANKDLNLYRLFKIVQNLGGYNKVTKEMKWPVVYSKMSLPSLHQNPAHQIKTAYKKYLDAFETFYRKLGSTMGTMSRPGSSRQNSGGRSILSFRAKDKSPKSVKLPEKVAQNKDDMETLKQKAEVPPVKPEDNQDAISVASTDDGDVVVRRTPRRDTRIQSLKEESKEKKEELEKTKKEDPQKSKKEDPQKSKKEDKKDESSATKNRREEVTVSKIKKEEPTSGAKSKKEELTKAKKEDDNKKEERKSTRKIKVEEEKETEKGDNKPVRGAKKQKEDEKKEEAKQEPTTPGNDSPKKRVTRRKLLPAEVNNEPEIKEEAEDKKEQSRKAATKEAKTVEKKDKEIPKTLERRDSHGLDKKEPPGKASERKEIKLLEKKTRSMEDKKMRKEKKGKEDGEEEGSDDNKTCTNSACSEEEVDSDQDKPESQSLKHDYPIGSKLRVKYGRGKNQKIYIAKVVDFGKDGVHKTYLVHYAGWNTRYDEWIRPDRVVSVLDRPEGSKSRTPPLRSSSVPGTLRKSSLVPFTMNTQKNLTTQNKPGEVFRTPKQITAKTRATRSSSSDTSVASKKTESTVSCDAGDSSDLERGDDDDDDHHHHHHDHDDDDNTREGNTEEDDILDVEEFVEPQDISKEKSAEASVDMNLTEDSASEMGSERAEEEEDEYVDSEKEMLVVEQVKGKSSASVGLNCETDQMKEVKDSVKEDICKVSVTCGHVAETSGASDVRSEKRSVVVAEVRDAVYEIRAAVFSDEGEEIKQEEEEPDEMERKIMHDLSLDSEDSESPRLEIVEEKESDERDSQECKPSQIDRVSEESGRAAHQTADQTIPQLKKVDTELDKKSKDCEKAKSGRGKKSSISKEGKKSSKASDAAGSSLASEIPTLEPMPLTSLPLCSKVEPSPYDFDAEVDAPWQPEIIKKWEPSQRTAPVKEGRDSITAAEEDEEKEKKKVKKKAKRKLVGPEFGDEVSLHVSEPVNNDTSGVLASQENEDASAESKGHRKKGRKKRVLSLETKKEVIELYESTVNSVVEAVKHSLQDTESDNEQRPAAKRRRIKRVSESDKKDSVVPLVKVGRKGASRDSLDVLDGSLNTENGSFNRADTSQNDSVLFRSMVASGAPCASTSAVETEECTDFRDGRKTSFCESQGFEPQLENLKSGAAFDNTPPTTPEREEEGGGNTAMQHQESLYEATDLSLRLDVHKDRAKAFSPSSVSLPASSSSLAPAKSASESPSDNDVTSTASTDNLEAALTAQHSESSGTDQDVPSTKKRKIHDDASNCVHGLRKKRVHGTRSRTARKSPKCSSDSQGSTSNTPSHCPESPSTKFADFSKSPRPSKYNFSADLGEYLEGEARCNFLIGKMREIKAIYMNLKAEVASIDRRRKRARRKEKESSQGPSTDKELAT